VTSLPTCATAKAVTILTTSFAAGYGRRVGVIFTLVLLGICGAYIALVSASGSVSSSTAFVTAAST
jgi:hypothetical protein